MKILVSNYTFDASEKKITFTDYNPIVIERVLLVTNVTDNIIIYNFADPTKGGTAATNVLTLTYDTTSMSDTDKLQIFYDDATTTQGISGTVTANAGTNLNTSALATSAKQLADNHQVTVSNIASTPVITGFATSSKQDTGNTSIASIDTKTPPLGQALAAASVPVILPAATISTLTPPAAITGFALESGGNLATIAGKDFATQTTLSAINSKMVSGTDIGDVTINNTTSSPVPVGPPLSGFLNVSIDQTGNNNGVDVLTIAAGDNNIGNVDLASAIPAGSALIGKVGIDQTTPGTTNKVSLGTDIVTVKTDQTTHGTTDKMASDITLIAGTATATGNGTASAGCQRVTIASDNTAFPIKVASGGIASGAIASGAIASGAIAAGAIAAGNTSIATTEDTARAAGEHLVKIGLSRLDTPVADANVSSDGDYTNFIGDNFGALWVDPQGNVAHDSADSGRPIKIGGRASTTPVTAVSANDRVDAFFDIQGRQVVTQKALTGTLSNVNGSASSVTILAANTARLGATIVNDSTAILYLKFGATASTTSYTVKLVADAYYEVPFGYYGIIDGIWASATGVARVTEIT